MVEQPRAGIKSRSTSRALRCAVCQRLIAKWVSDLGYTIDLDHRSYCRFCYLRLRNAGKIQPKSDDTDFISGINWELSLIEQVDRRHGSEREEIQTHSSRRATPGSGIKTVPKRSPVPNTPETVRGRSGPEAPKLQMGICPACRSTLSFNIRGHANAEGICPKCNRHIQLLSSGDVKLVPTRAAIILSVARRTGALPEVVEEIYSYVIDEIAARISEHPILGIPELGTFQVKQPEKKGVEFKPSRRLLARIATRQPEHDHDVTRLFSGKRGQEVSDGAADGQRENFQPE